MENKHTGKIILFYVLMFTSSFGEMMGELLRNGYAYDYAVGYGFLSTLLSICVISIALMLVPFICKIIKERPLAYKTGKKICLWNSIVLFVLSCVLMSFTGVGLVGGIGAIFFYFINKWIFVESPSLYRIENTEENATCDNEEDFIENIQQNPDLDIDKMSPEEAAKYLMALQLNEHYSSSNDAKQEDKKFFCKLCGNIVDSETKKCTGCGKQYFKGIKFNKCSAIVIALFVLLTISIIFNFIQIADRNDLDNNNVFWKGRAEVLQEENEDLEKQLNEYEDLVNFIDDYVVFVEDDGSNQYHKYECYKFTGDYFWAYNIEAAEDYGYKKCPICH